MDKEARNRALDKIQKCLAMASDKRGNAQEAATALRQAQALMRKFDISERELGIIGYCTETVHTTIQAGKKVPLVLSYIVNLMMRAFGVRAVYTRVVRVSDLNFSVDYLGPEGRVKLAAYAHVVVQRAVDQGWKEYLQANPHVKGRVGARAGFYTGWIAEVAGKVETLALTDEEQERVTVLVEQNYSKTRGMLKNNQKIDGSAARAGARAAEDFSLHRPMGKENLKLEAK